MLAAVTLDVLPGIHQQNHLAIAAAGFTFAPAALLAGIFGFGVAALLFLAVEELLVEAHETADTPILAAMFFIGFFALYILDASH